MKRDLSTPLAASGKFHPADKNKDGRVSNSERVAYNRKKNNAPTGVLLNALNSKPDSKGGKSTAKNVY